MHVHVDDLSHVLVAETAKDLECKLLKAGRIVGSEVKRLCLTLTRKVAKQLSKEGIPLAAADTAGDVGVQLAGGEMRAETTLNERIHEKGAPRATRIRGLVMV